jgi:hypothetical protein
MRVMVIRRALVKVSMFIIFSSGFADGLQILTDVLIGFSVLICG